MVLEARARAETILIAAWTRPTAGTPEEVRREQKANRKAWQELPPARDAQNPFLRIGALDGVHAAFVRRVMEALGKPACKGGSSAPTTRGGVATWSRSGRRCSTTKPLTAGRPTAGHPALPGRQGTPRRRRLGFFTPTVARQIMTSNAQASSNMRTLDMGGAATRSP